MLWIYSLFEGQFCPMHLLDTFYIFSKCDNSSLIVKFWELTYLLKLQWCTWNTTATTIFKKLLPYSVVSPWKNGLQFHAWFKITPKINSFSRGAMIHCSKLNVVKIKQISLFFGYEESESLSLLIITFSNCCKKSLYINWKKWIHICSKGKFS